MFIALIAALLVNPDFGHQATEVLGIIRKVIKIGGVEVVGSRRNPGAVEDYVERFAARQRGGVWVFCFVWVLAAGGAGVGGGLAPGTRGGAGGGGVGGWGGGGSG